MRTETQQALKEKQDELATKRSTCDENTSTYKATITAETSQRAQAQAETTAYSAKNGAYDAKCAQLKTRSDDSATAYDEAMAETNAEKTKEMQDQEIECNTLQSALTVLTNKQTGLVQTGAGTGVMTQAMTQKLYDVVARETNVVDADTVIAAIQAHKAQTTYSTAVGQTGGFGTIVGIVMGLHNHCLETKDRLETELAQLNDHLDEQRSLTKQIMESDATALNTCQTELAAVLAQLQIAQSNL